MPSSNVASSETPVIEVPGGIPSRTKTRLARADVTGKGLGDILAHEAEHRAQALAPASALEVQVDFVDRAQRVCDPTPAEMRAPLTTSRSMPNWGGGGNCRDMGEDCKPWNPRISD
jgi:hypothetical protein